MPVPIIYSLYFDHYVNAEIVAEASGSGTGGGTAAAIIIYEAITTGAGVGGGFCDGEVDQPGVQNGQANGFGTGSGTATAEVVASGVASGSGTGGGSASVTFVLLCAANGFGVGGGSSSGTVIISSAVSSIDYDADFVRSLAVVFLGVPVATTYELPSESNEFIRVGMDIRTLDDPTAEIIEFGVSADKTEEPTDWVEGQWEAETELAEVQGLWTQAWVARVLASGAGAGGDLEIDDGISFLWSRFSSSPQTPIRRVGKVKVT